MTVSPVARQSAPPLRLDSVTLRTGVRLQYAEQGNPDGEPIVFIHGYTDSWWSFSRIFPLLSPGYRAFAISLRGHGDSERPTDGYGVDDTAADVVAFMDAVGVPRAALVGHSGGSYAVRRVAETHPERVSRLVLVGSSFTVVNEATRELQEAVRALEDPVPPELAREFQTSTIHVPVPAPFFERVVAESLKLPARVWQAALAGLMAFDDAAELARITAPTLILWGEQDAFFPRPGQERLAAAIPGARLLGYPQTGHDPHWERPEQFVADLEELMRDE